MTRLALFSIALWLAFLAAIISVLVMMRQSVAGLWGGGRSLSRERSGRLLRAKRRQQRLLCSAFAISARSDPFRLSARSDRLPRTIHRIICFATTTTAIGMRCGSTADTGRPWNVKLETKTMSAEIRQSATLFHFSIHVILQLVYSASNAGPTDMTALCCETANGRPASNLPLD